MTELDYIKNKIKLYKIEGSKNDNTPFLTYRLFNKYSTQSSFIYGSKNVDTIKLKSVVKSIEIKCLNNIC